jgi:hypothetical protein
VLVVGPNVSGAQTRISVVERGGLRVDWELPRHLPNEPERLREDEREAEERSRHY